MSDFNVYVNSPRGLGFRTGAPSLAEPAGGTRRGSGREVVNNHRLAA